MKKTQVILFGLGLFFLNLNSIKAQSNYTDNESINSLLEKKRSYNKNHGTGFRIQLYNGAESKAKSIKYSFNSKFPGVYSKLLYETPDWKVQVGNYRTRLDADKALNKIKEEFNGGIIIEK